jgi:hypothetical protein
MVIDVDAGELAKARAEKVRPAQTLHSARKIYKEHHLAIVTHNTRDNYTSLQYVWTNHRHFL